MKITKIFLGASVATAALCGAGAHAADLPVKEPYVKAPYFKAAPIYNWTGFYVGANAGVGVSQTSASTPAGFNGSLDLSGAGFAGGVQAGYNWQFAPQWVAGLEGDIGFLGIKRSFQDFDDTDTFGVKADWYGTVRGRFGYTNGPSLFYATGGAAFVNVKNNFDNFVLGSATNFATKSETATGWTAGGGVETLLGGNWSAKAEYLYINAGSQDVFNAIGDNNSGASGSTAHFDNRFHVYRYGLNYKFGGPAVSAATPLHHWTGLYFGVNAGAGLSQDAITAPPSAARRGNSVDIAEAAFTGGVQAGYNWQFAPAWVVGLEADIAHLGIKGSVVEWNDEPITFGVKVDWYSTLRGRLGYSTGPALLYVTGGAAFVNVKNNFDFPISDKFVSKTETASGWTVGGGVEAALAQNWTAKTEYLYIDAGSQDVLNPNIGNKAVTAHFDNRFHVFRFGLNYAFGGY